MFCNMDRDIQEVIKEVGVERFINDLSKLVEEDKHAVGATPLFPSYEAVESLILWSKHQQFASIIAEFNEFNYNCLKSIYEAHFSKEALKEYGDMIFKRGGRRAIAMSIQAMRMIVVKLLDPQASLKNFETFNCETPLGDLLIAHSVSLMCLLWKCRFNL